MATPDQKARIYQTRYRTLLLLVALFCLIQLLNKFPTLVEHWYVERICPIIVFLQSLVFGFLPFSSAEILLYCSVALGLAFFTHIVWSLYQNITRHRTWYHSLGTHIVYLCIALLLILDSFYLLWGLAYARPDFLHRSGWTVPHPNESPEKAEEQAKQDLVRLCNELVDLTNQSYREAFGKDDLGHASSYTSLAKVDEAIEQGYPNVQAVLHLSPSFAWNHGRAKGILASRPMCFTYIAGFYSPWTGEANYNRYIPPCELPHTVAHEKAHQRLITSEDEANFFGVLGCIYSPDPYVRYSGYLFAQRQLLFALLDVNKEKGLELVKRRIPGVQRDVDEMKKFWNSFRGSKTINTLNQIGGKANDLYLKANGVKGGIESYEMSTSLLVLYGIQMNGFSNRMNHHENKPE